MEWARTIGLLASGADSSAGVLGIVVPAAVTALAAVLGAIVTIATIGARRRDDQEARKHNVSISMLSRRIDSLEQAWAETFYIEQGGAPRSDAADLVRGSIWMPSELQAAYVKLLGSNNATAREFSNVRRLLQAELERLSNND